MLFYDIIDFFKYHWKVPVIGIVIVAVIVAIVFSLPIITITSEKTITEYGTETTRESYVENEPVITTELVEKTRIIATGQYKVVPNGVWIPFTIEKDGSVLVGRFSNIVLGSFTVLNDIQRIVWEMRASEGTINLPLPPGSYWARFREDTMWGEDCTLELAIQWSEFEQVTTYKQVTQYRDVPRQVEKQKVVTTEEKISIWKNLFRQR